MSAPAPRFRRALRTIGREQAADAEVLDDFHHFGLTLSHDSVQATAIVGWAERYPSTTCVAAPGALAAFEGARLDAHPLSASRGVDPRLQCTHLFELATLALAQAARGPGVRTYEVEVTDPQAALRRVKLWRDKGLILDLEADEASVRVPPAPPAIPIRALTGRALAAMAPDEGEAWMIVRRALQTARGRQMPLHDDATPAGLAFAPPCFTGLPQNLPHARRMAAAQRDFSADPAFAGRLTL